MSGGISAFDVAVIGGGPGGYAAAIRAAQNGMSVALVERAALGGTCLNVGCIPTKALLRSAEVAELARHASELGVRCEVTLDYAQAQRRSQQVVAGLVQGVESLMRKNRIRVLRGQGRLLSTGRVRVEGDGITDIEARHIVLATGSAPRALPGLAFDGQRVISSDDAVRLTAAPAHLVIVGGGPIGLEFACVFRAFGSKVTLVEMQSRIAPLEDKDAAEVLAAALQRRGIDLRPGCRIGASEPAGAGLRLQLADSGDVLHADKVLVAIGRRPVFDSTELESAGIRLHRGFVDVDAHMRTSVPGIWAIGDLTGGAMLAHRATHQALIAADAMAGKPVHALDALRVPSCIYTHPQLASVGLTEEQARAGSRAVKVSRFPLRASGKALALGETEGFVKLVCDAEHGEILGAHVVGPDATELIAELVLAKTHELTADDIAAAVHPHPTLGEAIGEAAMAVRGAAIHF